MSNFQRVRIAKLEHGLWRWIEFHNSYIVIDIKRNHSLNLSRCISNSRGGPCCSPDNVVVRHGCTISGNYECATLAVLVPFAIKYLDERDARSHFLENLLRGHWVDGSY